MYKNILLLVPALSARGGITNYYKVIKPHLTFNYIYFIRGARNWPKRRNSLIEGARILKDIILFIVILQQKKINLLVTSTSLGKLSLRRDALFILTARVFKVKSIVFFRGWNPQKETLLFGSEIICKIFFSTQKALTLNRAAKNQLIKWGYRKKIFIETTAVDDELVKGWELKNVIEKYTNINNINILYLARIEKEKGVFEAVHALEILHNKYPNIIMNIVGDGTVQEELIEYLKINKIEYIKSLGFLEGEKKKNIYMNSHIYLFPSYTEGMPTSVLEAMAFGMPIITRLIGGLVDFFENKKNGFITESIDPFTFAQLIEKIITNKKLMMEIGRYNYSFAHERFLASKVSKRFMSIIEE